MEKKYYTTIGLEIHAELKTDTKMFCSCKNDPDEEKPNVNICPVCMAHPGTLPVANKKAIENVIKVGLAIDANIADFSEFDRKNYFYPDIPKGYQISQYKYPIVSGGKLAGLDITRIHLEEDTATSKHDKGDFSLVDYNRAGVPLMELVTEAHTFENPEDAAKAASVFAKEYQLLLWYLGVSEANMEKGEMRVEANVSISPDKDKKWTTYVEVKNLNSFKSVEKAIKYEVERMIELFEEGKESEIVKETRGWDEMKQKTVSQRKKESSQDYRYFPDPDLPKMKLHEAFDLDEMKKNLSETPAQKRARYKNDYGIKDEDIEMYVNNRIYGIFFEKVSDQLKEKELIILASNYIKSDVVGILNSFDLDKNGPNLTAEYFAKLMIMLKENRISSRVAKDMLQVVFNENSTDPEKFAEENGLLQKNDTGALTEIAQKIIDANEKVVADYKAGKEAALMSLVGQMMKETKGSANPQVAKQLLIDLLK
jgi:aspartyl-tRNA(Asn)/glutamyl-tRNA(Gln) amidotransferase subunit B